MDQKLLKMDQNLFKMDQKWTKIDENQAWTWTKKGPKSDPKLT